MARKDQVTQPRALAAAIAQRLGDHPPPAALKPKARAFLDLQKRYETAATGVDSADDAVTDALTAVRDADSQLDSSLERLGTAMIGAGLGTRARPLGDTTKYTLSDLQGAAYKTEADEVARLTEKLTKAGTAAEVKKLATESAKLASNVLARLKRYGSAVTSRTQAMATRDLLAPDILKSIASLKTHARAALESDPAAFRALFAAPSRVTAPKKRRTATGKKNHATDAPKPA